MRHDLRHRVFGGEFLLALGVIALGVFFVVETLAVPSATGYSQVGPRAYPWVISIAMILIGAWLARDALTGKWIGESRRPDAPAFDLTAFVFISLGLILDMLLITRAGFVIASVALFACVARAFGSRRLVLDVIIGLALALAAYVGFDHGLGLDLPAGFLEGFL